MSKAEEPVTSDDDGNEPNSKHLNEVRGAIQP